MKCKIYILASLMILIIGGGCHKSDVLYDGTDLDLFDVKGHVKAIEYRLPGSFADIDLDSISYWVYFNKEGDLINPQCLLSVRDMNHIFPMPMAYLDFADIDFDFAFYEDKCFGLFITSESTTNNLDRMWPIIDGKITLTPGLKKSSNCSYSYSNFDKHGNWQSVDIQYPDKNDETKTSRISRKVYYSGEKDDTVDNILEGYEQNPYLSNTINPLKYMNKAIYEDINYYTKSFKDVIKQYREQFETISDLNNEEGRGDLVTVFPDYIYNADGDISPDESPSFIFKTTSKDTAELIFSHWYDNYFYSINLKLVDEKGMWKIDDIVSSELRAPYTSQKENLQKKIISNSLMIDSLTNEMRSELSINLE